MRNRGAEEPKVEKDGWGGGLWGGLLNYADCEGRAALFSICED